MWLAIRNVVADAVIEQHRLLCHDPDLPAERGERDVLSKSDFSDFVAFVQRFGAKVGVMIPDPDPEMAFRSQERAA